ncbi:DUF2147 domain-containing protein, partial [Acinetobacter baumannii]|uniref:DUF2147 domain-containing protein n=1 Tax=Acinetobacter baumannii TaxID=470 RepID=UPI0038929CC0
IIGRPVGCTISFRSRFIHFEIIGLNKPYRLGLCNKAEGTYKNKSLIGLTIVKNLKNVGQNKYDKGSILDPQSDKTYRFSVTVSPDGEKLTARGYIGISAIGRNQTWYRVK